MNSGKVGIASIGDVPLREQFHYEVTRDINATIINIRDLELA